MTCLCFFMSEGKQETSVHLHNHRPSRPPITDLSETTGSASNWHYFLSD